MWLIVAAGMASVFYSAFQLPTEIIDGYFLLLTLATAVLGSRIAIRIPQISGNITLEDTFVFIALLLYGGEAAVMVGTLAGICSALRISRRVRTVAFGSASLACSVLATATVLKLAFGSTTGLLSNGPSFAIIALSLMGMVHIWSTPESDRSPVRSRQTNPSGTCGVATSFGYRSVISLVLPARGLSLAVLARFVSGRFWCAFRS